MQLNDLPGPSSVHGSGVDLKPWNTFNNGQPRFCSFVLRSPREITTRHPVFQNLQLPNIKFGIRRLYSDFITVTSVGERALHTITTYLQYLDFRDPFKQRS